MQFSGGVSNNVATVRLNSTADINTYVDLANRAGGTRSKINPELFYTKQLLDTIRYDASQYVYYRLADETPITDKSDKLQLRRWAPLQAHIVPLVEGIPPKSDRGSVEEYTIGTNSYGRYMEFTDKVDFQAIDPIVANYTKEYSLVAMETFDMLAREQLFSTANKFYAGGVANYANLTIDSVPNMTDLRLIILDLKKKLVKPRANGRYHVIGSPEFFFDMLNDPTVQAYMSINNSTKTMYEDSQLVPMFDMEFYETLVCPETSLYINSNSKLARRMFRKNTAGTAYLYTDFEDDRNATSHADGTYVKNAPGYLTDGRTGQSASYIPSPVDVSDVTIATGDTATVVGSQGRLIWKDGDQSTSGTLQYAHKNDGESGNTNLWTDLKVHHILIVGKEALLRTGLAGEGNAKVYVKQKGSAGVLDPIDQRQSIGFKINSVGFGSVRLEAAVDYICVPSQANK